MPTLNVRVLIVDDEPDVCQYISASLHSAGVQSEIARDGAHAIEILRGRSSGHFGLVLLDVKMPGTDGWELLAELREAGDEIPVIFVSARSETEDRVRGLRLGADDFVVKPFSVSELSARVKSLLRRSAPERIADVLEASGLKIDRIAHRVTRFGRNVLLGPTEYRLLELFMENSGRVLSRSQLLNGVWGHSTEIDERTVDVHVGRLRKAIVRGPEPDPIRTVRGTGYAFDEV